MLFVQVERFAPLQGGQVFLIRDAWNDYGFVTMYQMIVVAADGQHCSIGNVKFGRFGAPDGWSAASELPSSFEALDEPYFSLGQDDTYYENLTALGDEVRTTVLTALRDLANDQVLLARAQNEEVTRVSLLRSKTVDLVSGQYRRIAHGGERLTPYRFEYRPPAMLAAGRPTWSRGLTFSVEPDRLPPTNVHVLIGRNGVGKSHLLRGIVRAVADQRAQPAEDGTVLVDGQPTVTLPFFSVVAVSFSVFDAFVDIPEPYQKVPYLHVGAQLGNIDASPDTPLRGRLAMAFAESLGECLIGQAADRWVRAVETLRYSGSGFLDDAGWIPRFRDAEPGVRYAMAVALFGQLSSGHAIVLLTITRLVERVQAHTLVVLDEPETHLHPPLLSAFVWALSDLLVNRNSVAIVATHSPVVLQEVPASCVSVLRQNGRFMTAEPPAMETFGENVGTLTHEVFTLEVDNSGYHRLIKSAVLEGLAFEDIVDRFGGHLGAEAKTIARMMIAIRDSGGAL